MKRDRLHRRYRALREAERKVATAPPGRKLEMRRVKVRVMAEILRGELHGATVG